MGIETVICTFDQTLWDNDLIPAAQAILGGAPVPERFLTVSDTASVDQLAQRMEDAVIPPNDFATNCRLMDGLAAKDAVFVDPARVGPHRRLFSEYGRCLDHDCLSSEACIFYGASRSYTGRDGYEHFPESTFQYLFEEMIPHVLRPKIDHINGGGAPSQSVYMGRNVYMGRDKGEWLYMPYRFDRILEAQYVPDDARMRTLFLHLSRRALFLRSSDPMGVTGWLRAEECAELGRALGELELLDVSHEPGELARTSPLDLLEAASGLLPLFGVDDHRAYSGRYRSHWGGKVVDYDPEFWAKRDAWDIAALSYFRAYVRYAGEAGLGVLWHMC